MRMPEIMVPPSRDADRTKLNWREGETDVSEGSLAWLLVCLGNSHLGPPSESVSAHDVLENEAD